MHIKLFTLYSSAKPACTVRTGFLTSHINMSKILVATGRGKEVRKMVRNQDDAYMEVWKLWAWK